MSAAGVGRADPAVEHRHLAEQRAGAEHRDHRLAPVGRLAPRSRPGPRTRRRGWWRGRPSRRSTSPRRRRASRCGPGADRAVREAVSRRGRSCRALADVPPSRLVPSRTGGYPSDRPSPPGDKCHLPIGTVRSGPEASPSPIRGASGDARADRRESVFVEGVRLFVVVLGTAAGFWVARNLGVQAEGLGGMLGCLAGLRVRRLLRPAPRPGARRGRAAGREHLAGSGHRRHLRRDRGRRARARAGAAARAAHPRAHRGADRGARRLVRRLARLPGAVAPEHRGARIARHVDAPARARPGLRRARRVCSSTPRC